jgi:hypothetical protein
MAQILLAFAGCGVEAAIGQLARLTSLHMSFDRHGNAEARSERSFSGSLSLPLQLQLLSGGKLAGGTGGAIKTSSCSGDCKAGGANTSLQELSLDCMGPLADEELAATAVALPNPRQLAGTGSTVYDDSLVGLRGSGLAAIIVTPAGGCATCRCGADPISKGSSCWRSCHALPALPACSSLNASTRPTTPPGRCRLHSRPSTIANCWLICPRDEEDSGEQSWLQQSDSVQLQHSGAAGAVWCHRRLLP